MRRTSSDRYYGTKTAGGSGTSAGAIAAIVQTTGGAAKSPPGGRDSLRGNRVGMHLGAFSAIANDNGSDQRQQHYDGGSFTGRKAVPIGFWVREGVRE